eukprot:gene12663-13963_t
MEANDSTAILLLRDSEIFKIKLSFSSLTNSVVVCPVVANLYSWKPSDTETWNYCKTGVPVLVIVHDTQMPRNIRQMQICIVDRDNGFATWRENITEESDYKMSQRNFHTIKLSQPREEGEMAGIKFPSDEIAAVFYKDVHCNLPVIIEPDMELSPNHSTNKKKGGKESKKLKKLNKEDISSPCMFTHVTSINNSAFDSPSENTSTTSSSPDHMRKSRPKSGFGRKAFSFKKR